jgi:hypothetical protein
MRVHIINENTFRDRPVGSALFAGRGWLYAGKQRLRSIFNAEWFFFHKAKRAPAITLDLGHGDSGKGVMLHVSFPWLLNVYLICENLLPTKRFSGHNDAREIGVSWFGSTIKFHIWSRGGFGDWCSKDPWYLHGFSLDLDRLWNGRRNYKETDVQPVKQIVIPMPEGTYAATLKLYTGEWKSRWGTKRIKRAEVEVPGGVPVPGKGENSWDCGEDAILSSTSPAANEWEAIGNFVESVMNSRCRHGGGSSWKPAVKAATT